MKNAAALAGFEQAYRIRIGKCTHAVSYSGSTADTWCYQQPEMIRGLRDDPCFSESLSRLGLGL